jgi:hypothetical protein
VSTILDALRKAQSTASDHSDHDDRAADDLQTGDVASTSSTASTARFADDLPTFDDPFPGRRAPAPKGPSALVAAGVAVAGLVLGVGAASLFTGAPLPFLGTGAGQSPDGTTNDGRVAAAGTKRTPDAPRSPAAATPGDESKSAATTQEVEARSRRERRRSDETTTAATPAQRQAVEGSAGAAATHGSGAEPAEDAEASAAEANVPGAAGVPAPGAPAPGVPAPGTEAPASPDGSAAPAVIARLPEGVPDALRPQLPEAPVGGGALEGVPVAPQAQAFIPGAMPPPVDGAPPTAVPPTASVPPSGAAPSAPPAAGTAPGPFAAATAPSAGALPNAAAPSVRPVPSGPVPSIESAPGVLDVAPVGAPEVSLLFIKWSSSVERRVASLRGPGGKLMLVHEGDIIEGMRVGAIRPDAIELQWRGTSFLLLAAR